MKSNGADWVAFCIQFICGAIAGPIAAIIALTRTPYSISDVDGAAWGNLLFGSALIAGAISAYFGHVIWYHLLDFSGVIPPAEPRHSITSQTTAFLIALIGLGFILFPFAKGSGSLF